MRTDVHAPADDVGDDPLPRRLDEVPHTGRPVAVACGSGYRSSVAASLLATRTELDVVNVLGGMTAWTAAGYPTTTDDGTSR